MPEQNEDAYSISNAHFAALASLRNRGEPLSEEEALEWQTALDERIPKQEIPDAVVADLVRNYDTSTGDDIEATILSNMFAERQMYQFNREKREAAGPSGKIHMDYFPDIPEPMERIKYIQSSLGKRGESDYMAELDELESIEDIDKKYEKSLEILRRLGGLLPSGDEAITAVKEGTVSQTIRSIQTSIAGSEAETQYDGRIPSVELSKAEKQEIIQKAIAKLTSNKLTFLRMKAQNILDERSLGWAEGVAHGNVDPVLFESLPPSQKASAIEYANALRTRTEMPLLAEMAYEVGTGLLQIPADLAVGAHRGFNKAALATWALYDYNSARPVQLAYYDMLRQETYLDMVRDTQFKPREDWSKGPVILAKSIPYMFYAAPKMIYAGARAGAVIASYQRQTEEMILSNDDPDNPSDPDTAGLYAGAAAIGMFYFERINDVFGGAGVSRQVLAKAAGKGFRNWMLEYTKGTVKMGWRDMVSRGLKTQGWETMEEMLQSTAQEVAKQLNLGKADMAELLNIQQETLETMVEAGPWFAGFAEGNVRLSQGSFAKFGIGKTATLQEELRDLITEFQASTSGEAPTLISYLENLPADTDVETEAAKLESMGFAKADKMAETIIRLKDAAQAARTEALSANDYITTTEQEVEMIDEADSYGYQVNVKDVVRNPAGQQVQAFYDPATKELTVSRYLRDNHMEVIREEIGHAMLADGRITSEEFRKFQPIAKSLMAEFNIAENYADQDTLVQLEEAMMKQSARLTTQEQSLFRRIINKLKEIVGLIPKEKATGNAMLREIMKRERGRKVTSPTLAQASARPAVASPEVATTRPETTTSPEGEKLAKKMRATEKKADAVDKALEKLDSYVGDGDSMNSRLFSRIHRRTINGLEEAIRANDGEAAEAAVEKLKQPISDWNNMSVASRKKLGEAAKKAGLRYSRFDGAEPIGETIVVDGVERSTINSEGQLIETDPEKLRNFWRWFGDSKVVQTHDPDGTELDFPRPLVVYHGTPVSGFTQFKGSPTVRGGAMYFSTHNRAKSYAGSGDIVRTPPAENLINDPELALQYGIEIYENGDGTFELWIDGDVIADDFTEGEAIEEIDTQLEAIKEDLINREPADFYDEWLGGGERAMDAGGAGSYAVYLKIDDPQVYDWQGHDYMDSPNYNLAESMDDLVEQESGSDGLIIHNAQDVGGFAMALGEGYMDFTDTNYVVYDSRQVKSATDNVGTYDAMDEDIRYSRFAGGIDEEQAAYAIALGRKVSGKAMSEKELARLFPDAEFDPATLLADVEKDAKAITESETDEARKAAAVGKAASRRVTRRTMRTAAKKAIAGELAKMRQEKRVESRDLKDKERVLVERGLEKKGISASAIGTPVTDLLGGTLVSKFTDMLTSQVDDIEGGTDSQLFRDALQATLRRALKKVTKAVVSRKNREGLLTAIDDFGRKNYRTVDEIQKAAEKLVARVQDRSELSQMEVIKTKMAKMAKKVANRKNLNKFKDFFSREEVSYEDAVILKSIAQAIQMKKATAEQLKELSIILADPATNSEDFEEAKKGLAKIFPDMVETFEGSQIAHLAQHISVNYARLLDGDKTAADVMDTYINLEDFINKSRGTHEAWIIAYKEETKRKRKLITDSLDQMKGTIVETGLSRLSSLLATPLQFLKDTMQATVEDSEEGVAQFKNILVPFINARGAFRERQLETQAFLQDTIERIYTDRKAYNANSKRRQDLAKYGKKPMTKWELMNLILMLENTDVQERAELNGNLGLKDQLAMLDDMRGELTETDREYMDALRDKLDSMFDEINETFKKRFGAPLTKSEFYWPIVQFDPKKGAMGGSGGGISLVRSFLKERVPNTRKLHAGIDMNVAFIQHMDSVARFMEYYDAQLLTRDVLMSDRVLERIEDIFGTTYKNRFGQSVTDEVNGVAVTGPKVAAVRWMRWGTIMLSIPFNIFSGMRQVADTPSGGAEFGWKFFPAMLRQFTSEGKEARAAIMNHPAFRADITLGGHPELVLQYEKRLFSDNPAGKVIHYVKDIVKNTDSWSRIMSAGAVLQSVRESSQILAIEDLKLRETTALNTTVRILQENLQSPMEADRPIIARKGGDVGRFVTTFTSALTPKVAAELQALNKAVARGDWEAWKRAGSRLLYYHVLSGTMQWAVYALQMSGTDNEDEEKWKQLVISILMGPFAGIPLFGRGMEALLESAAGEARYGASRDPASLVWSTAEGLAQSGHHATQGEVLEAYEKAKKTLIRAAAIGRVSKNLIEKFED